MNGKTNSMSHARKPFLKTIIKHGHEWPELFKRFVWLYTLISPSGFVSKSVSIICEDECANRLSLACSIGGTADYAIRRLGGRSLPNLHNVFSW